MLSKPWGMIFFALFCVAAAALAFLAARFLEPFGN